MADLVPQLREALAGAFGSEDYLDRVRVEREKVQAEASARMDALRAEMQNHGLELAQDTEGMMSVRAQGAGDPPAGDPPAREEAEPISRNIGAFTEELRGINRWAVRRHAEFSEKIEDLDHHVGDMAIGPLMDEVTGAFAAFGALVRWLTAMRVDIVESLGRFRPPPPESGGDEMVPAEAPERYYAVNLFVDHADDDHPSVVLEANPTYENIFGRMEYRQFEGVLETDFTLIRSGSIHRANGGVLVLRADAIARNAVVWEALKGALRDGEVALEEPERAGALPVAGAPRAKPVPLDLKVVVVGAPRWYYTFFSVDPEFRAHFKVKADIDGEMDATDANIANYTGLIRGVARDLDAAELTPAAIGRLLAAASRLAGHREKLSARFELIASVVSEARALTLDEPGEAGRAIDEDAVAQAIANRRRRNARVEDRLHENIARGIVMIDTDGAVIGQVNALTVRDLGDPAFGMPARVTARASIGRRGVTNIEREVAIGGPIQQKGVMVLQGFLAGHFARRFPLSFNCSITFEQSYGGVEGDSASVAEVLAIISDLAGLACRQDLSVTGSVNQRGQVQRSAGWPRRSRVSSAPAATRARSPAPRASCCRPRTSPTSCSTTPWRARSRPEASTCGAWVRWRTRSRSSPAFRLAWRRRTGRIRPRPSMAAPCGSWRSSTAYSPTGSGGSPGASEASRVLGGVRPLSTYVESHRPAPPPGRPRDGILGAAGRGCGLGPTKRKKRKRGRSGRQRVGRPFAAGGVRGRAQGVGVIGVLARRAVGRAHHPRA